MRCLGTFCSYAPETPVGALWRRGWPEIGWAGMREVGLVLKWLAYEGEEDALALCLLGPGS